MHGGEASRALVELLCERKRQQGLVREHPDFPGQADMLMYYVVVEMSHSRIEETRERVTARATGAVDMGSEAAAAMGSCVDSLISGSSSMEPGTLNLLGGSQEPPNKRRRKGEKGEGKGRGDGKGKSEKDNQLFFGCNVFFHAIKL